MTPHPIDTAVRQAREVMDGFMVAFNAEDADAMRKRWFNFPHVRFHGGRVTIMERPEDSDVLVTCQTKLMSAYGGKADMARTRSNVCF